MERKFKIGDTIICPSASIPDHSTIVGIEHNCYVFAYYRNGKVNRYASFTNEANWDLVSEQAKPSTSGGRRVGKKDILQLLEQALLDWETADHNESIQSMSIKKYDEWKANL